MSYDSDPLSLNSLVQLHRDLAPKPPARRHRTTVYRTAKRLIAQTEYSSAGIYWTPEQIAAWHPDDFHQLCERVGAAGVQGMDIRGELCFHCEP
jgi:hypothetical protein